MGLRKLFRRSTRNDKYESQYDNWNVAATYNRPTIPQQTSYPPTTYNNSSHTDYNSAYTPSSVSPASELPSPYSGSSTAHSNFTPTSSIHNSPAPSQPYAPVRAAQNGAYCPRPSCGGMNVFLNTKSDRNNVNSGRPYRKCNKCGEFNGFRDNRGLHPSNPLCHCQNLSSLQAKRDKNRFGLHELFYSCQYKSCRFYEAYAYADGQAAQLNDAQVFEMVRQGRL